MGKELEKSRRWPKWIVALPSTLDNLKAWHRLLASSGIIIAPLWWRGVRRWVVDPENALLVVGIAVPVVCWFALLISLARNRPSARFKRLIPKMTEVTDLYYERGEMGSSSEMHLADPGVGCPLRGPVHSLPCGTVKR